MSDNPSLYLYLFGPVPSRRLGRSLGIDLTPSKTCTYNCLYCQIGATTAHTIERREWVPTGAVIDEIRRWAKIDGEADVITLAGSGEPTLHTGFGRVLQAIAEETGIRSVLLTNGSLLTIPEVRADARSADVVKITFSAADPETWRRLHRPAEALRFDEYLDGVRRFREEYKGEVWLEVMTVAGVNDTEAHMRSLADLAAPLQVDRIQLNTVVRPPADAIARPPEAARMQTLARLFDPPGEIIAAHSRDRGEARPMSPAEIIALVTRHPSTAEEVARAFGRAAEEARALLNDEVRRGALAAERRGRATYYGPPHRH